MNLGGRANQRMLGDVVGAAAGEVGEYLQSFSTSFSALTSGTTLNYTSLMLPPGDWDVSANVSYFFGGSASYTVLQTGISLSTTAFISASGTNAVPGVNFFPEPSFLYATAANVPPQPLVSQTVGPLRILVNGVIIPIFLLCFATFTVGTLSVSDGILRARRMQ
jgi:hypothetical protein